MHRRILESLEDGRCSLLHNRTVNSLRYSPRVAEETPPKTQKC